jgi:hypothetical protein
LFETIKKAKENYRNSIIALKMLRDKLKKTEEKLSQSQNEISKLSIRAAISFTELTPRPIFEPIFSLLSETRSDLKEKSTNDKTQIIYEKLKMILTMRSQAYISSSP